MRSLFYISLTIATLSSLAPLSTARAQITPDNSLGAESSVVTGDVINDIPSDRISGGATRGLNLFHSFQEFNVGENRGAYFSNPNGIANILTRVTGGNPSNILGTLGVLGNANLFLINPKGIYFGSNARLNLGGSFFATTADSLVFDNNFEFSATNPQAPPLLTVNIPIGLRFRDIPGSIINNANSFGLGVQPGKSLALVGGDVNFNSGLVVAPGGRVELGGLAQAGTVRLNADGSLSVPQEVTRANVLLTNGAIVDVTGGEGGNIAINARNLELSGSYLVAGIGTGFGAPSTQAGDIVINATENVTLKGEGNSSSFIVSDAIEEGDAGSINILTRSLFVIDGSRIASRIFGRGNAGSININAQDTVSFSGVGANGASGVFSSVQPTGVGNGGDITITTNSLSFINGAFLFAGTFGQGNAGNINFYARDVVSFDGSGNTGFPSGATSIVGEGAIGKGGNINFTAGSLFLTNGAQVSAATYGLGDAGNVNLTALKVSFDGLASSGFASGVFSSVEEAGRGNGGNVNLTASSISLTNGAQISAATYGQGDAGNINLTALKVSFDGLASSGFASGVFSSVEEAGRGNGGNVNLTASSISLTNGAQISAATLGKGNGGNLRVLARQFDVQNQAEATVSSREDGNAGNIQVRASEINLYDQGKLTAESASGKGGNISLQTDNLLRLRRNSLISAISGTPGSVGQDGNININTPFLVAFPSENSDIVATGFGRSVGSNVQVNAQGIFGIQFRDQLTPQSDIVASGKVTLITPEIDPSKGLVEFPETVTDPSDRIAENPCQRGISSTFVITGRGGLPTSPNQSLKTDNVRVDLVEPTTSTSNSQSATINQPITYTTSKQIIPAQGWVLNKKGEVVLVAYDPTATNLTQRASSRKNAVCPAPF
ncbi:two-partner secretion domain-containing protein [Fischerella sp. PCC 9605]|uniref:two-partner secretion domain-containing protein n=1 Tax=Fischerella sp. PCC 9605 TaxID=1173024 RepID=UPI00047DC5E3|nr:filamentous hemagglutinin N-terminal domain-containing protein [Fischerella sp. PCC 9605]